MDLINRKNIAKSGILLCCVYFVIAAFFVLSGSQNRLIIFEIVTMLSGIYFVFLITNLPFSNDEKNKIYKIPTLIFVTGLMFFTTIAHLTSLTVIKIIEKGINIPEYFQIGKIPSVITSIEYFGWGIFLGLSFLFSSFGIENTCKYKPIRITLLICAILCFLGYFSSFIIEYLWYIASMGYGIGTVVICIEILLLEKKAI
jgi:hypothetical protein